MKDYWNRVKKYVKENPEAAAIYAFTAASSAALVASFVWAVRESNQEIEARNKEIREFNDWSNEEARKGRLIMFTSDGYAWSIDPTKPIIEMTDES